ncbi:MAG: arsenite efflux transporter metallochaperone ArsD [Halanaerobiales bacterium]|nr:arsenite efflux transporter metallochaperone ArsD [Halanaerobiales bacterium]
MLMEIYDPPMCCSSGLCGPDVDEKLMDVNDLILELKDKGIEVKRYLINQQPNKFMEQKEVAALLQKEGVDILPVTVLDGDIIKQKNYPGRKELEKYINIK